MTNTKVGDRHKWTELENGCLYYADQHKPPAYAGACSDKASWLSDERRDSEVHDWTCKSGGLMGKGDAQVIATGLHDADDFRRAMKRHERFLAAKVGDEHDWRDLCDGCLYSGERTYGACINGRARYLDLHTTDETNQWPPGPDLNSSRPKAVVIATGCLTLADFKREIAAHRTRTSIKVGDTHKWTELQNGCLYTAQKPGEPTLYAGAYADRVSWLHDSRAERECTQWISSRGGLHTERASDPVVVATDLSTAAEFRAAIAAHRAASTAPLPSVVSSVKPGDTHTWDALSDGCLYICDDGDYGGVVDGKSSWLNYGRDQHAISSWQRGRDLCGAKGPARVVATGLKTLEDFQKAMAVDRAKRAVKIGDVHEWSRLVPGCAYVSATEDTSYAGAIDNRATWLDTKWRLDLTFEDWCDGLSLPGAGKAIVIATGLKTESDFRDAIATHKLGRSGPRVEIVSRRTALPAPNLGAAQVEPGDCHSWNALVDGCLYLSVQDDGTCYYAAAADGRARWLSLFTRDAVDRWPSRVSLAGSDRKWARVIAVGLRTTAEFMSARDAHAKLMTATFRRNAPL